MRKIIFLLCVLGLLINPASGEEARTRATGNDHVFFEAVDPEGDDYGPGTYVYPRNKAFQPYKGLFDLLSFKVLKAEQETIYFDVTIHTVTNPWAAPEGFIHPVIHIYISTGKNGSVKPIDGGPDVVFTDRHPWKYAITLIAWENSALYYPGPKGELEKAGLSPKLLPDGKTIRVAVPEGLIGSPRPDWHYYVLVGSYDGFGPGFFRDIKKDPGDWVFGGGIDEEGEPRVLDLLAPATGKHSQTNQLEMAAAGTPVCLYPVGLKSDKVWSWPVWVLIGTILLAVIVIKRKPAIVGFWLKSKEE
ncbi:MAG TPA: glucodextranase DOMON-like domain-containing protein [Bacillota bacterium]